MTSVNTKVKIIVLGASGTGKSSLCKQYVKQVFEDAYEPTVEALFEVCVLFEPQYAKKTHFVFLMITERAFTVQ